MTSPTTKPTSQLDSDAIDDGWVLPEPEPEPAQMAAVSAPAPAPIQEPEIDNGWALPEELAVSGVASPPVDTRAAQGERVMAEPVTKPPLDTHAARAAQGERVSPEPVTDLNSATLDQLMALPGVGRKKAENIIKWREEHKTFASVADLAKVTGFGQKSVDKLAAHLTVA